MQETGQLPAGPAPAARREAPGAEAGEVRLCPSWTHGRGSQRGQRANPTALSDLDSLRTSESGLAKQFNAVIQRGK